MKWLTVCILLVLPAAIAVAQQADRRQWRHSPTSTTQPAGFELARRAGGGPISGTVEIPRLERPRLSTDFQVLLHRSIFSRFGLPGSSSAFGAAGGRPPTNAAAAPQTRPAMPGYENRMAVRGTAREDEQWLAFIEDIETHQLRAVMSGEHIAGGRIVAVTLNGLQFQKDERLAEIAIGFNLAGTLMPVTVANSGPGKRNGWPSQNPRGPENGTASQSTDGGGRGGNRGRGKGRQQGSADPGPPATAANTDSANADPTAGGNPGADGPPADFGPPPDFGPTPGDFGPPQPPDGGGPEAPGSGGPGATAQPGEATPP